MRIPATVAAWFVVLTTSILQTGCMDCPSNVHGVHSNETIATTIVSRINLDDGAAGCPDLGDLPPGATITSNVGLHGGAESCADQVDLTVVAISTGTVTAGPTARVTLANGCEGWISLRLVPRYVNASFLDDGDAGAAPPWTLERSFSGTCPAPVGTVSDCTDSFVATNAALN